MAMKRAVGKSPARDKLRAARARSLKVGDRVQIVNHHMAGKVGRIVAIIRRGGLETLTVKIRLPSGFKQLVGLLPSQVRKLASVKKRSPETRSAESFAKGDLGGDQIAPGAVSRGGSRGVDVRTPGSRSERSGVPKSVPRKAAPKSPSRVTRSGTRGGGSSPPGPPKPAKTKVACYFQAEMDREVVVEHTATIEVRVSREAIDKAGDQAAAQGKAKVSADRKLLVQAIPKKNFELKGEGHQEIDPPLPGAPQTLYFDVRATDLGSGEVWIVVRQGPVPLVTLPLDVAIVPTRAHKAARAAASGKAEEAPGLTKAIHQLFIYEQKNFNQLSYRFQLQMPDLKALELVTSNVIEGDRSTYVANLYRQIEDRWLSKPRDLKNFYQELRAFGAQLWDRLFPPKLQEVLWTHRKKIKSIMVISEEPFIPWELVHLKEPGKNLPRETLFLGQLGLVRWLHFAGWPADKLKIRKTKARYVIPSYHSPDRPLPEARKEAEFLQKRFSAKPVHPESGLVRKLLSQPGTFDLLHFACHGEADENNIAEARLLMEGRLEQGQHVADPLSATVVEQFANLRSPNGSSPIVVLNACQAGRQGYQLTGNGGFAQAFLRAGASAFIGTLWSVEDNPARTFTETFYSALLDGLTIAEATIKARRAAEESGKESTWLAYVVYGHPHARLKSP
jgi:hypothetical protein